MILLKHIIAQGLGFTILLLIFSLAEGSYSIQALLVTTSVFYIIIGIIPVAVISNNILEQLEA